MINNNLILFQIYQLNLLLNIIKTSIAFSSPSDEYDYLKRLYSSLVGNKDLKTMQLQGFTVREIEY